jgi:cellulose synthase/poly-beta-1,6-N-acetylglucosamine synthase-like glycosyltransferase
METLIILLKIAALALTGIYFLLILMYSVSWERIKIFSPSATESKTFISVVVAARNEEKNILQCLHHLSRQNYPFRLFEIIIANDFSEDSTQQLVESFIQSNKTVTIKLIHLSEIFKEKIGSKKAAIAEGVKQSNGELIVTTDADCTMGANWLKTIADYYETHQAYMICGPVVFSEKNLFDKIQSLEFMSLIGIGAAAIQSRHPLMCNAANLAFKREIFFETGRADVKNEPSSGDDTFLMFAIRNKYNDKIAFLKSPDAIVETKPQFFIKEFFNQRIRWISKVKNYSDYYVQLIGIVFFLFNMMILFSGIASLFAKTFLAVFLFGFALKLIIDFIFMAQISTFFKKRNLLLLFFPSEVLHVFYLVIISVLIFSKNYEWKKRNIKT